MNKASAWVSQTALGLARGLKPARPVSPSPPEQALARFHEQLQVRPSATNPIEARQDEALHDALLGFIHQGATALDLSSHGAALTRLPAAAMTALVELNTLKGHALLTLRLPPRLAALPAWVLNFAELRAIELPDFIGRRLDLREMGQLESLSLVPVRSKCLTVLTPKNCDIRATRTNGTAAHITQRRGRHHNHWRIARQPANLNGVVRHQGADFMIYCRHMALAQLRASDEQSPDAQALDPTSLSEALATPHAVEQNVRPDDDALFDKLMAQPDATHFVHHEAWGKFVALQIDDMQAHGESIRFALLTSVNHAMALRLVCRPGETPYVECLDPNYAPRTARSESPFKFHKLFRRPGRDMPNYFPRAPDGAHGFGSASHVKFTPIKDPHDLVSSLRPSDQPPVIGLAHAGLPQAMHPTLIAPLLMEGQVEEITPHVYRWLQGVQPSGAAFKALWMHDEEGEPSALTCASLRGHAQAFDLINEMVQFGFVRKLLASDDVFDILRGTPNSGQTPLAYALQGDHPPVVERFLSVLDELARQQVLTPEHVARLLNSHRPAISSAAHGYAIGEATYRAFKAGVERLAKRGVIDAKTAMETMERLPRPRTTMQERWTRV